MQHALFGLAVVLIVATLLPYWRSPRWWIRVWDFPRVQLLVAIGACGLGLSLVDNPGGIATPLAMAGLAAAGAIHLAHIWRYTPLARLQVPSAGPAVPRPRRLRILFANVLEPNRRDEELLTIIAEAEPDIVLLVETDGWWEHQLGVLAGSYRHVLRHPLANTYGMHLFSRLPLRHERFRFLVEPDVPSAYAEVQLRSGDWIAFFGVHPRPPQPAQDTDERDAELLIVGHEAREEHLPAIVTGDLNDVAWSHTTRLFQRISGLLDPRIGRGLYSTFHAQIPLLRWPLDHLFHDPRFTLVELRRLPAFGSDHFPVLVELAFEPERAHEIHVPAPARRSDVLGAGDPARLPARRPAPPRAAAPAPSSASRPPAAGMTGSLVAAGGTRFSRRARCRSRPGRAGRRERPRGETAPAPRAPSGHSRRRG